MKRLSHLTAVATLGCCLTAAPALAELADDSAATSLSAPAGDSLQILDTLVAEMLPASEGSLLAAGTKSVSPMGGYYTGLGVDSSSGSVTLSSADALSGDSAGSATTVLAPSQAAGPTGANYVGSGTVVGSAQLQSAAAAASGAVLLSADDAPQTPQAPVPIPPAMVLMGTGLLGLLPLRRALRQPA